MNNSIAFGIREQTLTLMCALAGIISQDKSNILRLMLSFAIASSIPDIYAFTYSSSGDEFRAGLNIFMSEMLVSLIFCIPLLLFSTKQSMFIGAILVGMIITGINEYYMSHKNTYKIISSILFAGVAVTISYLVTYILRRLFK